MLDLPNLNVNIPNINYNNTTYECNINILYTYVLEYHFFLVSNVIHFFIIYPKGKTQ
jgi:hypothetical protein